MDLSPSDTTAPTNPPTPAFRLLPPSSPPDSDTFLVPVTAPVPPPVVAPPPLQPPTLPIPPLPAPAVVAPSPEPPRPAISPPQLPNVSAPLVSPPALVTSPPPPPAAKKIIVTSPPPSNSPPPPPLRRHPRPAAIPPSPPPPPATLPRHHEEHAPPPTPTTPPALLPHGETQLPPAPAASPPPPPPLPFSTGASYEPPPPGALTTAAAAPAPLTVELTSVLPAAKGSGQAPRSPTGLIAGGVIAAVFVAFVAGILFLLYRDRRGRKKKKKRDDFSLEQYHNKSMSPSGQAVKSSPRNGSFNDALLITMPPDHLPRCSSRGSGSAAPPLSTLGFCSGSFSYDELLLSTNGFSEANLLGQGGFGLVYKGCLANGQEVAVKRLKDGSRQGDREFQAEVELISRVHHKHLVSLVGHCITETERLLVYEFVANNTLEFHLHGSEQPVMEWTTRLRIAIGSARGLAYLHEDCHPTIIHRDIKASNILLDHKLDAKLSDFGLAKSFTCNGTSITHVTTKVVGTFGYLAPEYASSGKVTEKSDVYSFGVILLELITGRPPISAVESEMKNGLVEWAKPPVSRALDDGDFKDVADPRLNGKYSGREMVSMAACAVACVRNSAWLRPRMSQVVRVLEGDTSANDLNNNVDSSRYSENNSSWHEDDMVNRFLMANQNQGINAGSGTTTSLYGLYPSSSNSDLSNN